MAKEKSAPTCAGTSIPSRQWQALELIDELTRARKLAALASWVGQARTVTDQLRNIFDIGGASAQELQALGVARTVSFDELADEGLCFLNIEIEAALHSVIGKLEEMKS